MLPLLQCGYFYLCQVHLKHLNKYGKSRFKNSIVAFTTNITFLERYFSKSIKNGNTFQFQSIKPDYQKSSANFRAFQIPMSKHVKHVVSTQNTSNTNILKVKMPTCQETTHYIRTILVFNTWMLLTCCIKKKTIKKQ